MEGDKGSTSRATLLPGSRLVPELQQLGARQGMADIIVAYVQLLVLHQYGDNSTQSRLSIISTMCFQVCFSKRRLTYVS